MCGGEFDPGSAQARYDAGTVPSGHPKHAILLEQYASSRCRARRRVSFLSPPSQDHSSQKRLLAPVGSILADAEAGRAEPGTAEAGSTAEASSFMLQSRQRGTQYLCTQFLCQRGLPYDDGLALECEGHTRAPAARTMARVPFRPPPTHSMASDMLPKSCCQALSLARCRTCSCKSTPAREKG